MVENMCTTCVQEPVEARRGCQITLELELTGICKSHDKDVGPELRSSAIVMCTFDH